MKDYFITKFRDNSAAAGTSGFGGNNWSLLLAKMNTYLGDQATATGYLDQMRERAALPRYKVAKTDPDYAAKHPTLKLAILHERRVKLAFEKQCWYELLRFFNNQELVNYFNAKSKADCGQTKLSNFGPNDRYHPIPFDENKLNPETMYQNPGY